MTQNNKTNVNNSIHQYEEQHILLRRQLAALRLQLLQETNVSRACNQTPIYDVANLIRAPQVLKQYPYELMMWRVYYGVYAMIPY